MTIPGTSPEPGHIVQSLRRIGDLQPVHAGQSALQIILATICVGVKYVGYSGVLITEQVSVSLKMARHRAVVNSGTVPKGGVSKQ